MKLKSKPTIIGLLTLLAVLLAFLYFRSHNVAVLNPAGTVAAKEQRLIIITVLLSLIVVIPVFLMTAFIAWRYRASNHKAAYLPDWDHSGVAEFAWWTIPGLIILALSIITWNSSHALDPFKPIASKAEPLSIQVVALDWKWLFIYPKQNIASVNMAEVPVNRPVTFQITSDTVMNSFWVPQLGSQIYAMPGMMTQLNLMATKTGSYYGSSANISGTGFSDMNFTVKGAQPTDFSKWVGSMQASHNSLSQTAYSQLSKPSSGGNQTYSNVQNGLFNSVVLKYMPPGASVQMLMNMQGGH